MKRLVPVFLICIILLLALPAAAQTPSPDCKPGNFLATLAKIKSSGDDKADLATLTELNTKIRDQLLACSGLKFSGKNAKNIGPLDLPEGLYKVTLTTSGYFIAKLNVLEGACAGERSSLYNILGGQATDGAETIILSTGCRVLITTSNVTASWTLTLESIQ